MKRILGIVGGTGPQSTIDYYRELILGWRERGPVGTYPRVIINSVEGASVIAHLGAGELALVAEELSAAVRRLAAAGAGAALLAANGTHLAFEAIAAASPIPLIHIVDAARDAALERSHRRLGLFGARFVMEAPLYPDRFAAAGMSIVLPARDEQEYIHEAYLGELVPGIIREATRERLVSIIAKMRDRDAIDGMILGGTELALILRDAEYGGVPILNTTQIHVHAAIDWLLDEPVPVGGQR